jgi:hypothetical protein
MMINRGSHFSSSCSSSDSSFVLTVRLISPLERKLSVNLLSFVGASTCTGGAGIICPLFPFASAVFTSARAILKPSFGYDDKLKENVFADSAQTPASFAITAHGSVPRFVVWIGGKCTACCWRVYSFEVSALTGLTFSGDISAS